MGDLIGEAGRGNYKDEEGTRGVFFLAQAESIRFVVTFDSAAEQ